LRRIAQIPHDRSRACEETRDVCVHPPEVSREDCCFDAGYIMLTGFAERQRLVDIQSFQDRERKYK